MLRVLLTGMSGVGKSSVAGRLAALGYNAIDTDDGWSHEDATGEWLWREDRMTALLVEGEGDVLFVAGTASNQVKFYPQFDHVILLTAPAELITARVAARTNNSFGQKPGELPRILHDLETIEPRLRRSATEVINTQAPLEEVVAAILRAIGKGA